MSSFNLSKVGSAGGNIYTEELTIANGEALSGGINMGGSRLFAIIMPAAWTAAGLTFMASVDGTNYYDLYTYNGIEFAAAAAADRYIVLEPEVFAAIKYIKVRSGTSATPVNQGADRTLTIVTRVV